MSAGPYVSYRDYNHLGFFTPHTQLALDNEPKNKGGLLRSMRIKRTPINTKGHWKAPRYLSWRGKNEWNVPSFLGSCRQWSHTYKTFVNLFSTTGEFDLNKKGGGDNYGYNLEHNHKPTLSFKILQAKPKCSQKIRGLIGQQE